MSSESRAIRRTLRRIDGVEKVTGAALYASDITYPGLLHCKVLRSPHAHGKILHLDTSEANRMPGVVRVITGKDVPGPFGVAIKDQPPLARERVRFAGEPVAVVVANSEKEASDALSLIRVEYEPLPFVLDPLQASLEGAPIVHEQLLKYTAKQYLHREGGNIFQHLKVRKGDVDDAFAKTAVTVEGEYSFPLVAHLQLEPHCAVARCMGDSFFMRASTQAPFVVQECISELLGIPQSRVQIVSSYLGGGFGGKSDVTIEPLTAVVAQLLPGRFVRLLLDREEMFVGTTLGRGARLCYAMGFDGDGRMIAMRGKGYLSGGGYADYAVNIVTGMANAGTGPYEVKNLSLDMYGVYTNTPPIGAARGYGHPEVHLAVEQLMDRAAEKLGISPMELRKRNLLREGRVNGIGQVMKHDNGNPLACAEIVERELEREPKPSLRHQLVGRGVASYMKTPCMPNNVASGALLKLQADGTVTLSTGAIEMGQGTYTALAQITAEALDLPFELVNVKRETDTLVSPYEWQTVASHTTWGVGNAILLAAEDMKKKLRTQASLVFGSQPEEVDLSDGEARWGGRSITWAELARGVQNPDGSALTCQVTGEGHFVARGVQNPDPETGQGNAAADWTFGCVGVEVSVDERTGEISLRRLVHAIDGGTIINPQIARDQVYGAMLMSVGSALHETLVFSDAGVIRNNSLVDYKAPGFEDVPDASEIFFVETPEESGPYGARGIGEHGAVGTAAAILSAIADATGVCYNNLPVTAGMMYEALQGMKEKAREGGSFNES